MKKTSKYLVTLLVLFALLVPARGVYAGNKDRSGSSGASELLINPWARSTGWGSVNTACVEGLEAMFGNIAGTAFTQKSEFIFAHTNWFQGSGISINAFGLTQKAGEVGVIGMSVMSMKFGEIERTNDNNPDPSLGSIGTFSPNLLNVAISYAKAFSNSIYGGINVKVIYEAISDVSAPGIALDAGVQYITGATDNVRFGISLKNVGPTMKFSGDGLSFRTIIPGQSAQFTVEQRSAPFELPAQLNIGGSYDFKFTEMHRLTVAANFTSNSFTKDQFILGGEYGFSSYLMLRAGYTYEDGIWSQANRTTVYTGPSAGMTVEIPFNKEKKSSFSVDYSYRATDPFQGTHCIGAKIKL